jgi:thymidine kinase
MDLRHPFRTGVLEVYCGPMKSGKTRELINRVDKLEYTKARFLFVKPSIDTRNEKVHLRFLNGSKEIDCRFLPQDSREGIVQCAEGYDVIAIDEAQFFSLGIVSAIDELVKLRKNLLVGGLDLDFRGEPFGTMPLLLARADYIEKLTAVCDYGKCNEPATRTTSHQQ